jgi:hypothetical protein
VDPNPHKMVWRSHQRSLEIRGLILLIASVASMVLLACLAEYHGPDPGEAAIYGSHRGLMDWIWHLRIRLWAVADGIHGYLPYEYVFYVGMMVLGIGITFLVMGATPDRDVSHLPDPSLWTWRTHDC